MIELLPADYVLCGIAIVFAVTGLFRGFSGTLAFVLAVVSASGVGAFGWSYSAEYILAVWMRAAATLVASLLAFGLVRAIIKKVVNGLLAQPSDALFGMLVGALFGVLLTVAWAWSGLYLEYSTLAKLVAGYLF